MPRCVENVFELRIIANMVKTQRAIAVEQIWSTGAGEWSIRKCEHVLWDTVIVRVHGTASLRTMAGGSPMAGSFDSAPAALRSGFRLRAHTLPFCGIAHARKTPQLNKIFWLNLPSFEMIC